MIFHKSEEPGVDICGLVDFGCVSRFDEIEEILTGFGASCGVEGEDESSTGKGHGLSESDGSTLSENWVGVVDLLEVLQVFGSEFFERLTRISVERAVCCKECLSPAVAIKGGVKRDREGGCR